MLRKLLPLLFALPLAAPSVYAQDTRTVNEPVFPPVCTVLPAAMAIVSNGPASETTPDTTRIQAALTACGAGNAVELAGSGTNFAFLSAPLNIPSGVSLIVDGGVTLFASRNREDYQSSPVSASVDECGTDGSNGNGCKNFLLFNNNSTNANSGLYGYGVIDGRGYATTFKGGVDTGVSWWVNADSYGAGQSQNNPIMMKLSKSTNFTLYKITLRNSPEFHVGWSGTGFTAWGVKIQAPWTAHNTDGIDPQGTNVTITNASISNGDDQIAVGASSASANITVQNSTLYSGHGMSVGSYTQGGLSNMLVQNVNMAGQPGDSNEDGIRLKSALDRGGLLKNLTYQNMCMRDVRKALYLTPYYNSNSGTLYPQFSNITFNNIHVLAPTGTYANSFSIQGYDANHQSTVTLNNVVYDSLLASNTLANYTTFALIGNVYPAFLQSLSSAGVAYTGTATANPTPAYDCTAASVFPYEVGELYVSTPTANNLQTAAITTAGAVTLNAMLQPAKSTQSYSGTAGSYIGAPLMTQPVQFLEGTGIVGTAALAANGTLASLTLTGVKAGTHTYTALYPGDTNYAALAFGSVTVNVMQAAAAATTTTLTSNPAPPTTIVYASPLVLTATVTGTSPTGSVRFFDGTTTLATVQLTGTSASTTQYLPAGAHSITATYQGDSANATSTSIAAVLPVSKLSEFFTFSATPTTFAYGQSTTFTANVPTPANGSTPTGTITISDSGSGKVAATGTLDATGTFTAAFTPGAPGSTSYLATYSGDSNYASSVPSGGNINLTDKASSVTTLKASSGPYGTVTSLVTTTLAAATPATTVSPSGSVSFPDTTPYVGAVPTGALNATAQVLYSGGSHTVTSVYPGDANFNASSSAPVTFIITPVAPGLALTLGAPSITTGTSTVLTAALSPVTGGTVPTGNVTFYDGAANIGSGTLVASGAMARLAVNATFTGVGPHSITAAYSGDSNYAAFTSPVSTLTVIGPPTFTLGVTPAAVTLAPGASTTAPVATVTPVNGFVGTVTFTCASPIAYVTCTVVSPTYALANSAPFSSNISITVAATVASAEPTPIRSFWLAALLPLAFLGLRRRKLRLSLLAILLSIGTLAISGCGSSSSTPTGSTSTRTPAGTQTLNLTASSGTLTMSTPITVTITN